MRYLNWLWRVALLLALLGFAVKNEQPVALRYFLGYQWDAPLVIVLLVFFAVGALTAVLALLPNMLRQRREIARLKREIKLKNKLAGMGETQQIPIQPS
ncbi:MAG: LapA family protein [Pseudomonadota bacterium]